MCELFGPTKYKEIIKTEMYKEKFREFSGNIDRMTSTDLRELVKNTSSSPKNGGTNDKGNKANNSLQAALASHLEQDARGGQDIFLTPDAQI